MKLAHSIKSKSGEEIAHSGRKINAATLKEIQKAKISEIEVDISDLEGAWVAGDVVDTTSGEILLEANSELTADKVSKILESGVVELSLFFPERDDVGTVLSQTLKRDAVKTPQEALIEIYRKLRPGDPPTLDTATALFHGMFFDPRKYDFSRVGRLKFNIKLFEKNGNENLDNRTLEPEDFYATIRYLLKLRKNIGAVDDIDHLGNRRVRAVGELMENQFRIGLVRMERAIKEKMSRVPGDVHGHAARPGERQAGDGGDPRVLRIVAAIAVHGSDQPAVGNHPQAASLRPWAGRLVTGARGIRSPRRSPHALRPHLPD